MGQFPKQNILSNISSNYYLKLIILCEYTPCQLKAADKLLKPPIRTHHSAIECIPHRVRIPFAEVQAEVLNPPIDKMFQDAFYHKRLLNKGYIFHLSSAIRTFESVMPQILEWLEAEPDHNAKELFIRLQEKHPDQFEDGQLRTLQRRVKAWRNEKARNLLQLYSFEEASSDEVTTTIAR